MTLTHDNYAAAEAMRQYGGGFVSALAECWALADPENKERLERAFEEVFEKYREVAERKGAA